MLIAIVYNDMVLFGEQNYLFCYFFIHVPVSAEYVHVDTCIVSAFVL